MEEGLKQRLVGAAVLVLLAVVFVPVLLESDPDESEVGFDLGTPPSAESGFSSRIIPLEDSAVAASEAAAPPTPEFAPVGEEEEEGATSRGAEIPETQPLADVSPADSSDSESLSAVVLVPDAPGSAETPAASEVDVNAAAAGKAEEQSPPAAWAAQLGSFAERRNALVLRNRLRAKGYPAFTQSVVGVEGEVTRVLVGPEASRDRTVATIEALRRDTGLDGFVVRHPRD